MVPAGSEDYELPSTPDQVSPAPDVERRVEVADTLQVSFSSVPLPPPEHLEAYEHTLPGVADRLLAMAESQQQHRHSQEKQRNAANVKLQSRGQWMAFGFSVLALLCAVVLLYYDKPVGGLVAIVTSFAPIITIFISTRQAKTRSSRTDQASSESRSAIELPEAPD